MNCILKAENIKKSYNGQEILKGLNLTINEGEFVSIIGQSGSGKSTLMYILSGLETPDAGNVVICDRNISELSDGEMSKFRKGNLGFIFQFYNLIDNLNVEENIMFSLLNYGVNKKEAKNKANELANLVGLGNMMKKSIFELSGGEQQRVSIARAIAIKPKIIFADEPTGNLDSETGIKIMNLLKEINEQYKTTIVMVTHNEGLMNYFDRVIKISDGKIY